MRNPIILACCLFASCGLFARETTVRLWEGNDLSSLVQPNRSWHCQNPRLEDGIAKFDITEHDPQVKLVLDQSIPAAGNHYLEIVAASSDPGSFQVFWASTKGGTYSSNRVKTDSLAQNWTRIRFRMPWGGEGDITALRLDPPDNMSGIFEVKSIRLFTCGEEQEIDASKVTGVVFEAQTPDQVHAALQWSGEQVPGVKVMSFTSMPDGARHTYWFDLTHPHHKYNRYVRGDAWKGLINYFVIERLRGEDKSFPAEGIRFVSGQPDLPPDIGVTYAGAEEAIPRAGRVLPLEIILRNLGTKPAQNIRFELDGPAPLSAADLRPVGVIEPCAGWDSTADDWDHGQMPNERRFRIILPDQGAGHFVWKLRISADGAVTREVPVVVDILPSLNLPKATYCPEPKPVKTGPYEIGVFLFPGWDKHMWHGVWTRAPWRKPVLGWYDETDPEVLDWEIKYLVENGVSFALVDWYWTPGGTRPHGHFEQNIRKAKYGHLLKWSLMWCDHYGAGYHSMEDQELVVKRWLELFATPEYQRIDGKPVVTIWDPASMDRDLGPGGCKKILEYSRQKAREAGFPSIYFQAVRLASGRTTPDFLKQYEDWGFDGTCVYKYILDGTEDAPALVNGYMPFEKIADRSYAHWERLHANTRVPFLPSLSTGYDPRPWSGESISPTTNVNVESFAKICQDARRFADASGVKRFLIGPADEWGEGSIAYPNRELGFGMLNAVRDAFGIRPPEGWPQNIAPEDVGLGPYLRKDDPLPWPDDFRWEGASLKDWTNPRLCAQCRNVRLEDGVAKYELVGHDPQIHCRFANPIRARGNQYVEVTFHAAQAGVMTVFWESTKVPQCTGPRCVRAPYAPGWTTLKFRMPWKSEESIRSLRIDPPDTLRGLFEIKSVRLFSEGEELNIDTTKLTGVVFEAQTLGQSYASMQWSSDKLDGLKTLSFTTMHDSQRHTYWFDFTHPHHQYNKHVGKNAWKGTVDFFDICRLQGGDHNFPAENVRFVSGTPDLPPDIGVTYAGAEEAIPRAGRPLPLEIILRNLGTRPAKNVRFELQGPVPVLDAADLKPAGEIGPCAGWDSVEDDWNHGVMPNERRFRITLQDVGAGHFEWKLRILADGAETREVPVVVDVLPSLNLPKATYCPEPKPVKTGKYEVGIFLFPGWDTHLWHGVWTRAPWRKPVLGWYDETNPEVIDWEIKYLVENGVSFAFVDWYWQKGGGRTHDHFEKAFPKAKYRHLLKWSLMWCNHCGPGYHSMKDQELIVKRWLELFAMPEYQRIDGKPVVSIWDPRNIDRDLGPGGCKKLLEFSRQKAREAGYEGIYFYAVRSPAGATRPEFLKRYEDWGFDGTCVYKYMPDGADDAPARADGYVPFKWLADTSYSHWQKLRANSKLDFLPSLTTAYDDRVWRGEKSSPILNINATDFARICRDARRFADESGVTRLLIGPADEWGEGSIAYPNREHGFGMLNAVRDAFGILPPEGWPLNVAPEDVGLGPYLRADDSLPMRK